ncbi:MAG: transcription repressor NadR [Coriobacteriaceae bacterium]|nr:transcription repressor NadR [Coriobacteriaceae bacterium]
MPLMGHERRGAILDKLRGSDGPVSGTALASAAGVSRQVIVQDIALLRADGHDIVATNRGYVLREGVDTSDVPTRLVKVRHGIDQVEDELQTIVDLGGAVQSVMVNHRAYGKITADLDIRSRRGVERYLEDIRSGKSTPLMTVTSGYHFHRITADTEAALDDIESALAAKGFLAEVLPYEKDAFE